MKQIISLNGQWDFVPDLDPKYHMIHCAYHRPDKDRTHWTKVTVPGCWQKYAERYDIFEGVCWFAREFDVLAFTRGSRTILRFGAVNYLCDVYVNGNKVGTHEGGYTAFTIDISQHLQAGTNHIAVKADNRATTIKWPTCTGYFNYGGIHRSVTLKISDGPLLKDLVLTSSRMANGWELHVRGQVLNMETRNLICIKVGKGLSWEDCIHADGIVNTSLPLHDVPDWSPENPHLESVRIELLDGNRQVIDSQEYKYGFREIAVQDRQVHLNGSPYTLKGICYVYDSPVHGLVMNPEQLERDLSLMKEAGCNAVRCHYPMDESFYQLCDQKGLLVWIEPPVYCYHPADDAKDTCFMDPKWIDLACQSAVEMIRVARNHACVAIYGIGNECNTKNPEAEGFFRKLADHTREHDPTRLISYAALYGNTGPLTDIVDVLGINSYYGWYDIIKGGEGTGVVQEKGQDPVPCEPIDLTPMRKMLDTVLAEKNDMVLLLTEFGADSTPGFHSRSRDLWSEEYHADLLSEIFCLARDYPMIAGTFPFVFSDYRDPSKQLNAHWNELNLKGMVSYGRRRKMAFDAIRETYTDRK